MSGIGTIRFFVKELHESAMRILQEPELRKACEGKSNESYRTILLLLRDSVIPAGHAEIREAIDAGLTRCTKVDRELTTLYHAVLENLDKQEQHVAERARVAEAIAARAKAEAEAMDKQHDELHGLSHQLQARSDALDDLTQTLTVRKESAEHREKSLADREESLVRRELNLRRDQDHFVQREATLDKMNETSHALRVTARSLNEDAQRRELFLREREASFAQRERRRRQGLSAARKPKKNRGKNSLKRKNFRVSVSGPRSEL